jgi:hypothetical protein
MDFNDDQFLDVCQNIEAGLTAEYLNNPNLTDAMCIFALDHAVIAIKQRFGFARNESVSTDANLQGIIQYCVELGLARIDDTQGFTLKEYVIRLEKIKRSVKRHSAYGKRAYFEFIKKYM